MRIKQVSLVVVVLAAGLLFGCGDKKTGPTRAGSPPPPIEPSHIAVPIDVSLDLVTRQVASKVPVVLKEKGYEGDPEGVKYKVTRGTIKMSARGDTLYMTIPVSFTAEMKRKGGSSSRPRLRGRRKQDSGSRLSCEASLNLTFQTRLSVTSDWKLKAKTTAGPRKWTQPCEMTRLKIDITKKVDPKIEEKVNEVVGTLDARIPNAVDIRGKVSKAWESLQAPKAMQQGLWLSMNPESIAMSPFKGEGNSLRTTVAIVAHPTITMGEPPEAAEPLPLPPNSGQASGDTYYIALEASLSFEDATAQARQKLVGQTYDVQGHQVRVTGARIYGDGDNFVIEATLAGPVDATIALSGRPHYDVPTGLLTVENLDYTIETKNLLANAADWLLHGTLQQIIAEKARFPLGEQIEQGKAGLEQALNKSLTATTTLNGTAERIRPLGVYVTSDAFLVIVVAEGKMWLVVK